MLIQEELNLLSKKGLKRELRVIESAQGPRVIIDGKEYLNFCSNNYLGLANDPRLRQAAKEAIDNHGFGSGASRLVCGSMSAHEALEKRIAKFKGTERCILFSTGYMANAGVISSLFGRHDVIFGDRLNHASLIDGIQLSGAKYKRYPHCDMDALESMLQETKDPGRKLIVTDSVFSMDGDIAPLDKIVGLANKYDGMVMVDEAHALGVMGKGGKGLVEHFGLEGQFDIQMGTLSKAAGSFGAYVCGSNDLIEFLINKARSFIYTTAQPPSTAFASMRAIDIIEKETHLRDRLWENTQFVSGELKRCGFDTLNSTTPIIPIVVGSNESALKFSQQLFAEGILVSAIRPPTVPVNTARLRVTVMADHSREDLKYLLKTLKTTGKLIKRVKCQVLSVK